MTDAELACHILMSHRQDWENITRGWRFDSYIAHDDRDVRKMDHLAVAPDGWIHTVHWSPYDCPDAEDEAMLIAVGFGSAPSGGNWDKPRLRAAIQRSATRAELAKPRARDISGHAAGGAA